MYEAFLLLMVAGIGISAYAQARRAGNWSWALFAATLAAAGVIIAVATTTGLWLAPKLTSSPGLATLMVVGVIAAGVIALTVWVNRMSKRLKR
jgi:hypothetical protein